MSIERDLPAPPSPAPSRMSSWPPPSLRIAVFYFCWLGTLGAFWPLLGPWLRSLGFSLAASSRIASLVPAMGLITPPLVGLLADARHLRPWLLRGATALSAIAFIGVLHASSRWQSMALAVAWFAAARAPVTSLTDAAAAEQQAQGHASFGRLRLWGSLGFLMATLASGALVDRAGMGALGVATLVGLALSALVAWTVPSTRVERHPEALASLGATLRRGEIWLFLGAVALAQAAGASFDSCFSLHLIALGHSRAFVGLAWTTGVAAEIIVLAGSGALLRRFRAEGLFCFAIAVAAVRWAALSRVEAGWLILLLQPLHGITFGLWYASAVNIARQKGGAAPTASQGLLSAASCAGSVAGMSVAGSLLALGGGRLLYGVASGVALAGAGVALLLVTSSRARAVDAGPAASG